MKPASSSQRPALVGVLNFLAVALAGGSAFLFLSVGTAEALIAVSGIVPCLVGAAVVGYLARIADALEDSVAPKQSATGPLPADGLTLEQRVAQMQAAKQG